MTSLAEPIEAYTEPGVGTDAGAEREVDAEALRGQFERATAGMREIVRFGLMLDARMRQTGRPAAAVLRESSIPYSTAMRYLKVARASAEALALGAEPEEASAALRAATPEARAAAHVLRVPGATPGEIAAAAGCDGATAALAATLAAESPPDITRRVAEGAISFTRWLPAIRGRETTEGLPRLPTDYGRLLAGAIKSMESSFANWEEIPSDIRTEKTSQLVGLVKAAPGEVAAAIRRAVR